MSVVVFVGPSLPIAEARALLDADYRPPARAGDVVAAVRRRPDAIAVIDGLFEGVPAVWHKELLDALARGIPVYGAASMGALRAAELHTFGMIGVGPIFEAFARGELEDDDEVAVVHAPIADGSRVLSEAMVNLRAGLDEARAQGLIAASTHARLIAAGKARHYRERSWPTLLRDGRELGAPPDELERLRAFVAAGPPDRKREDARLLLRRLAADAAAGFPRVEPSFALEPSVFFDALVAEVAGIDADAEASGPAAHAVVRRARLVLPSANVGRAGLLLALASAEADRRGIIVGDHDVLAQERRIRRRLGLADDAREGALADVHLTASSLRELARLEAVVDALRREHGQGLDPFVALALARDGHYAPIAAEITAERALLERFGVGEASLEVAGASAREVLEWLHHEVQALVGGVEAAARELGFTDGGDLLREAVGPFMVARTRRGGPDN